MKASQKQLLVAALSAALTPKFNAVAIVENQSYANFSAMENEDGTYTLFASPAVTAPFNRVAGFKSNMIDIGFQVAFNGCSYNQQSNEYEWDSMDYELTFGEEQVNLIFGDGNYDVKSTYGNLWYIDGMKAVGAENDIDISKKVLSNIFNAMTEDHKKLMIKALFDDVKKTTDAPVAANNLAA